MESILLGHIYHMINNDSMIGHTVKNNSMSRDQKEPIGTRIKQYILMRYNKDS